METSKLVCVKEGCGSGNLIPAHFLRKKNPDRGERKNGGKIDRGKRAVEKKKMKYEFGRNL